MDTLRGFLTQNPGGSGGFRGVPGGSGTTSSMGGVRKVCETQVGTMSLRGVPPQLLGTLKLKKGNGWNVELYSRNLARRAPRQLGASMVLELYTGLWLVAVLPRV